MGEGMCCSSFGQQICQFITKENREPIGRLELHGKEEIEWALNVPQGLPKGEGTEPSVHVTILDMESSEKIGCSAVQRRVGVRAAFDECCHSEVWGGIKSETT